jgi:hypothetical protein
VSYDGRGVRTARRSELFSTLGMGKVPVRRQSATLAESGQGDPPRDERPVGPYCAWTGTHASGQLGTEG